MFQIFECSLKSLKTACLKDDERELFAEWTDRVTDIAIPLAPVGDQKGLFFLPGILLRVAHWTLVWIVETVWAALIPLHCI